MVDESDWCGSAIYCYAAYYVGAFVPVGYVLKSVAVNDGEVFNLQSVHSIDLLHHPVMCLADVVVFSVLFAGCKCLVDFGAMVRSSSLRSVLRELFARPSASRIVGHSTMWTLSPRSATMALMTAICCQSFSPKYALSGRTM